MPSCSSSALRARQRRGGRNAEVRGVKEQILEDVEAAIGIRALRNDADALAHAHRVGSRRPRRRRARVPDVGLHARRENADRRRLAGAVRTEQTEELTLAHVEVEPFERDDLAASARHRRRRRAGGPPIPGGPAARPRRFGAGGAG